MQHAIAVDLSTFPEGFHSRRLVGPRTESGIDTCSIIVSRVPPGTGGPNMHTHPVDQFYYILSGEMDLQLGDEHFKVLPHTLVSIPKGTPHCNTNSGSVDEVHVEVFVPAPPKDQPVVIPAEPKHVPNAKDLIRTVASQPVNHSRIPGFRTIQLARRSMGSENGRLYVAEVDPGSGGPKLHFHEFDQFYYIMEGELEVQIGLQKFMAGPNTLVVLPAGVVHSQNNIGNKTEKHIAMIIPEPKHSGRLDHEVMIVEGRD